MNTVTFLAQSLLLSILLQPVHLFSQISLINLESLNSPNVEYAPSVNADNTTLIFQSDRDGSYKIYESKQTGNSWSAPVLLPGINDARTSQDLIGGPSISYDGNFIYFFASSRSGYGAEDIYFSERLGSDWSNPINLGKPINSKGSEGFPTISSDGKSIYFMRLNKNILEGNNCYTLLVSHRDSDGLWGVPKALPSPVNQGCEKYPRILSDNETLIFSSMREGSIGGSWDLYETRKIGENRWSEPVPLDFVNTEENELFGTVSSKGDKIYLVSKVTGNFDLFAADIPIEFRPKVVVNIQGAITNYQDEPLKSVIRVIRQSDSTEIALLESNASNGSFTLVLPQGDYELVISSDGFKTLNEPFSTGQITEYELIRKDFRLEKFAAEVHIDAINARNQEPLEVTVTVVSEDQEVPFSTGFFKAEYLQKYQVNVSREGYETAELAYDQNHSDTIEVHRRLALSPQKPKIHIQPHNADTGEPMPIKLMVKDLGRKKNLFQSIAKGDTLLDLNFDSKFTVYAMAPNFLFHKATVDLTSVEEYEFIEYPLEMIPIKVGAKLTLEEIYFDFGSAQIQPDSEDELRAVFDFLKQNRSLVVEISAHTDNVGAESNNLRLSQSRAKSVVDHLLAMGVPQTMLEGKGYGEQQPVADNNTDEGRAKNRRVDFRILKMSN